MKKTKVTAKCFGSRPKKVPAPNSIAKKDTEKQKRNFFDNLGFSLVELIVVVAIIAALSLIAAPAYRDFQARSRRSEGWNLMSTYYSAAIAAKAEYGNFPGNFVQTDFQPKGELGYRVTVQDGIDANIAINDNGCTVTTAACTCGGGCTFKEWVDTGLGTQGNPNLGPQPPAGGACGPVAGIATGANSFSFRASGRISVSATNVDTLGMDERKQQQVCVDGAK